MEKYELLEMEVIEFEAGDIVATSDTDTPDICIGDTPKTG